MINLSNAANRLQRWLILCLLFLFPVFNLTAAQNSVCAEVKIVIEQKLSFERQAFDARMVISNGLTSDSLQDVSIDLFFLDRNSQPVVATQNANDTAASFFYRTDSLSGINAIGGSGTVAPSSKAEIHWLIIPAAGIGGTDDRGALYYVGANVTYTLNGQTNTVEVTPDYIVVKPQPMLTLDYFLPTDVYADDPFTPETEPSVPFTLGVRIKNTGAASSTSTVIESAQPRIVENRQNLLIGFEILGGYVSDEPAGKSLLLDFGEIAPGGAKVGRWNMITTLSGRFVSFDATYSHADSLGGALTSLLQQVNTHTLVHDVKVDLRGRDAIKDFLALDNDVLRVYESDGVDTLVTNQSASAQLRTSGQQAEIEFPATPGFVYVKLEDPYKGAKYPVNIQRSDGKTIASDNVWLSRTRNDDLSWSYFLNIFDVDSTGRYGFIFVDDAQTSLSGAVYHDLNNNGILDPGESGVAVLGVELQGTDDNGVNVSALAYTDATGGFEFINLNPGRYSLQVASRDSMVDGAALAGTAGGGTLPGQITGIVLSEGMSAEGILFAKRDSTAASTVTGSADLAIQLNAAPFSPEPGNNVTFTLTAINNGPDDATGSLVNFALPNVLTLLSNQTQNGTYTAGQWQIGTLTRGQSATLVLIAQAATLDNNVTLTAQIGAQTSDPDTANNTAAVILTANTGTNVTDKTFIGMTATGTGIMTAKISGGGENCRFNPAGTGLQDAEGRLPIPQDVRLSHGVFEYELIDCDVGGTITLTMTWPDLQGLSGYLKYGPAPFIRAPQDDWYAPLSLNISGNTVIYSIQEGGHGDNDQTANGIVRGLSGPHLRLFGSGAQSIPVFGRWGQLLLVIMLLLIGHRHFARESRRR